MTIKEKVEEELKTSLKAGDALKVSVLRMLKSAVKNGEIAKIKKFSDEEVVLVVSSEIKKRKESIEQFKKGNRNDLVEKEEAEKKILEAYMPEQLSDEELKKIVDSVIKETGASSAKDIGRVMGKLMLLVRGKADGSAVSGIVKEILK